LTNWVYFILKGVITINIYNYPGIKKYGKDEIVGVENVFHYGKHYSTSYLETKCHVYKYPLDKFRMLALKYPEL